MVDKNIKVLVVDDMRTMLRMVRNALNDLGLERVIEAKNAETALQVIADQHAAKDPVGLIISDWNMPDMDGIAFLKKVRSTEISKQVLFLMLTANRGEEEMATAKAAGANGFMSKPFSVNDLASKLKEIAG